VLPTVHSTRAEFGSASAALQFVAARVVQRFIVPLRDLAVDTQGRLSHVGTQRIEALQGLPLADDALASLHRILGVPAAYAARIEPSLHVTSVGELLARHLGVATVVVEHPQHEKERRTAVAVAAGARATVPNEVVLERLGSLGVDAAVVLRGGVLDVRFGGTSAVDLLPGDGVRIRGALRNDSWGQDRPGRSSLEVSMYLLRLVCENGLFAQRELASRRAHSWSSSSELSDFVARQIGRVLAFPHESLRSAAARMSEEVCSDDDRATARRVIARHVSDDAAHSMLAEAVSTYEVMNATTGAAHHARSAAGVLQLQMAGGALLDRYLPRGR
jgi:hypothetical protein